MKKQKADHCTDVDHQMITDDDQPLRPIAQEGDIFSQWLGWQLNYTFDRKLDFVGWKKLTWIWLGFCGEDVCWTKITFLCKCLICIFLYLPSTMLMSMWIQHHFNSGVGLESRYFLSEMLNFRAFGEYKKWHMSWLKENISYGWKENQILVNKRDDIFGGINIKSLFCWR